MNLPDKTGVTFAEGFDMCNQMVTNEINEKILWEVFTTLWRFRVFVTDSKIHQTLKFYLKSTKANRSAKVSRVLSGKFIESSTTLPYRARLHKCNQNTYSKLVLTKANLYLKLTFILFEEVTKSMNYFSEFAVNHSISNCQLAVQKFLLSHYYK